MEDYGLSTLVTDRVTKLSRNESDSSSSCQSIETTKSHYESSPDQFYSALSSSPAQNSSDSSLYVDLHLSNIPMGRDYLYNENYEDDTAPSEYSGSDSEIDEYDLRRITKVVETHCVASGDGSRINKSTNFLMQNKKIQEAETPESKCNFLFDTNKKLQDYYRNALKSVEKNIDILATNLVESRETLRLCKYQSNSNPMLEKLPSYPYFKDSKKFTPPLNSDALKKKTTEGFNFQRLPATIKWQKWEMKLLDLSVRKEVFLSLEQPLACRKQLLEKQLNKRKEKGRPTKKTQHLLNAINKEIDALTSESMFEILYNAEANIDWMKISTTHFKGKRSPEECEGMWITNQNLKINRSPWTKEEIDRLMLIAKEHNNQDWDKIAEIVGNGRSAFQCALYQQLQLNHERTKWSPAADKQLTDLVKKYTKKGIIIFEKIASEMPGRTTKQVRRRWTDTIDPRIRKGFFTKTEDTILSTARFHHRLNFRQIARLLPGRTPNQLRCRYTRLEFVHPVHPWCQTEDEKLLHLIKNNNQRNWNYMVKHFNDRNLQQLRARYHRLRSDAKRAGKKLMFLDPEYDPTDEKQVAQNYVPDYDKEQNEKTKKYVPVTSLMKMVNRKGRRGKRVKKPDIIDKEIAMFFRNASHLKSHGRDKKNHSNIDEMIDSQVFYAKTLNANFDWDLTEEDIKTMNPRLYKDLQVEGGFQLMRDVGFKNKLDELKLSNTEIKYALPPSLASLTGMRSLMLQKPIHEVLNEQSTSDEEREDRKEVTEVMKKALEKLDAISPTPSNTESSGNGVISEQEKHLQMLVELKDKIEEYANIANSSTPSPVSLDLSQMNYQPTPPQTSPESCKEVTNLTPRETLISSVHPSVPRGFKYKYECLTPKDAFGVFRKTVNSHSLPVIIEETCLKSTFTNYYKQNIKNKKQKCSGIKVEKIEDKEKTSSKVSNGGTREKTMDEKMELVEDKITNENDTSNILTSEEQSENISEKLLKELKVDNEYEDDLNVALKLWLQRFVSIFYLPGAMSMVQPKFREDVFDGKRMTCKGSDELDTSSDSDSIISSITPIQNKLESESPTKPGKSEMKKKKKDSSKPGIKNHNFDLKNPPMSESERKKILLAKWLKYRNYKIRELEDRKKKGLKDEWEEEQSRLQAIDQEAIKEMVERIPGKRGRPRRLRRRKRALNKRSDEEDNTRGETNVSFQSQEAFKNYTREENSQNLFLQPPSARLEIYEETQSVLKQYKDALMSNIGTSISLLPRKQRCDPSIDDDSE